MLPTAYITPPSVIRTSPIRKTTLCTKLYMLQSAVEMLLVAEPPPGELVEEVEDVAEVEPEVAEFVPVLVAALVEMICTQL